MSPSIPFQEERTCLHEHPNYINYIDLGTLKDVYWALVAQYNSQKHVYFVLSLLNKLCAVIGYAHF
mgnify:CR=1 FL=1